MRIKLPILLLCCLSVAFSCIGQSQFSSKSSFTPSTPDAAQITKYGDVPVSLNTGTVQVSIPFFNISMKSFNWPIGISYHSGGIKVSEASTVVGTGWKLDASGMVTTKLEGTYVTPFMGNLDLSTNTPDGSPTQCNYNNPTHISIAENYLNTNLSFLPDVYYFSSVNFSFKRIGTALIPVQDFKVSGGGSTVFQGQSISYDALVIDNSGNKYYYKSIGSSSIQVKNCPGNSTTSGSFNFHLIKVVTRYQESLDFNYQIVNETFTDIPEQTRIQRIDGQVSRCVEEIPNNIESCNVVQSNSEALLTSIVSSNGVIIRFIYEYGRLDNNNFPRLSIVKNNILKAGVEHEVSAVRLLHSYFGSGSSIFDRRLRLDKIQNTSATLVTRDEYVLEYDPEQLPSRQSFARDWAGFYNGAHGNTTLIPGSGINRNMNLSFCKAGALTSIRYPTGGKSSFQYELKGSGGLRIKQVLTQASDDGPIQRKEYIYPFTSTTGHTANINDFISSHSNHYFATLGSGHFDVNFEPSLYLLQCNYQRIHSNPVISTDYGYLNSEESYSRVDELIGLNGESGKIEYTYLQPQRDNNQGPVNEILPHYTLLSNKKEFRRDGSQFILSNETINTYQISGANPFDFYGSPSDPLEQRFWIKEITKTRDEYVYNLQNSIGQRVWCKQYLQRDTRIAVVPVRLISTTNLVYEQNGTIQNTTSYSYSNPNHLYANTIVNTSSDQKSISSVITYPQDLPLSGIIGDMVSNNIVGEPITTIQYRDNIAVTGYRKQFLNTNNFIRQKEEFQILPMNNNQERLVINFELYDSKNNILQVSSLTEPVVAYVWGYQQRFLIAKVIGATYAEIMSALSQSDQDLSYLQLMSDNDLRSVFQTLRNNLNASKPSAQIFTYLHEPGIGIKEETSPAGITLKYQYDLFNRLSLVLDQNNNILKRICYNIFGQPEICFSTPPPGNQNQTTVYVRLSVEGVYWSGTVMYGNVVARFYSNSAGTIPLQVNNLSVNYQISSCAGLFSSSLSSSSTQLDIGVDVVLYEYYWDPNTYSYWDCSYLYDLLPGNYIIIP